MLTYGIGLMLCCVLQTKDPVEYVMVLLGMRDKYEATISKAFADDKSFRNTLNQVGPSPRMQQLLQNRPQPTLARIKQQQQQVSPRELSTI
jgi:hypothetical protein